MSDRPHPTLAPDGVPFCAYEKCVQYDGKRCRMTGSEPRGICEPYVQDMVASIRIAKVDDARLAARLEECERERKLGNEIASKVNAAINRAGIHCALYYWEAIDRIAAERDSLRAQLASAVEERDNARAAHAALIKNYSDVMDERNKVIRERDEALASRDRQHEAHATAVFRAGEVARERDAAVARRKKAERERDAWQHEATERRKWEVANGADVVEHETAERIAAFLDKSGQVVAESRRGKAFIDAAIAIRIGAWKARQMSERLTDSCEAAAKRAEANEFELEACRHANAANCEAVNIWRAQAEASRAERDDALRVLADLNDKTVAYEKEIIRDAERDTAKRIASFVEERLNWDRSNDAALYAIANDIRAGAWKGKADE